MKTEQEVNAARTRICEELSKAGLSYAQLTLLRGISIALCWVNDDEQGPKTMSLLMSGEPIKRSI